MIRHVVSCAIVLLLSGASIATPGLLPVTLETMNGVWESSDFGTGRFYRLEVRLPLATLIVASPKAERGDFVFRATACSVVRGTFKCTAQDPASGMEMRVAGKAQASESYGIATLSLRVPEGKNAPLFKEWNEPARQFWKRGSWSRMAELAQAERRAEELSGRHPPSNPSDSPGQLPKRPNQ